MCLLFCTWTMRGVLEKNLNQNRQNLWKNRKGRKYRFHCVWMLNRCVTFESNRKETRAKEEQQCPATHWRDRSVCALFSCQLFIFTIYSIYLFCLSYSCVCVFCLSHSNTNSNLHFQSVLFIEFVHCKWDAASNPYGEWDESGHERRENNKIWQKCHTIGRRNIDSQCRAIATPTNLNSENDPNTKHISIWFILMIIN